MIGTYVHRRALSVKIFRLCFALLTSHQPGRAALVVGGLSLVRRLQPVNGSDKGPREETERMEGTEGAGETNKVVQWVARWGTSIINESTRSERRRGLNNGDIS